MKMFV